MDKWADYERWRGNCYEAAFKYVWEHDEPGLRLCHGEPIGRGPINMGVRFGHAWVEREDGMVIDVTSPKGSDGIPWLLYYSLGNLTPMSVRRYTREEAAVMGLRHEHYGPWPELKTKPRRRRRR